MNEIKILVRTQNSAKAGFDAVDKEIDKFAKTSSEKFARTFSDNLSKNITTNLTTHLRTVGDQVQQSAGKAGDTIGDTIGRRVSDKISTRITERLRTIVGRNGSNGTDASARSGGPAGNDRDSVTVRDRDRQTVHVDVDVDKQSLLSRMASFGKQAGEKFSSFFGDGFKTGLTGIFSGDLISTVLKGAGIAGLGIALGPVIGAAISSSILLALGGGAIAIGIAGALQDPRIQTAITGIKGKLKSIFDDFGSFFKGPLENFFAPGNKGGGGLIGLLEQIQPMIHSLGESLGPVADKLGSGIIGLLQNALPGIIRAIDGATPIINVLADELPGIGDAIGDFFDMITDSGPGATQFFKDFLNILQSVIRWLGMLIEGLSAEYLAVRKFFLQLNLLAADWADTFLAMAQAAFSWIPGIGPKLQGARDKIKKFRDDTNKTLNGIHDVEVTVRIRQVFSVVGQVAGDIGRILSRKASGGAIGQAASGGGRSGLTWVGEGGAELLDLPPGARVHSNADSRRMAGQAAGAQSVVLQPVIDKSGGANRELIDVLLKTLRFEIGQQFGGSAQAGLGS